MYQEDNESTPGRTHEKLLILDSVDATITLFSSSVLFLLHIFGVDGGEKKVKRRKKKANTEQSDSLSSEKLLADFPKCCLCSPGSLGTVLYPSAHRGEL